MHFEFTFKHYFLAVFPSVLLFCLLFVSGFSFIGAAIIGYVLLPVMLIAVSLYGESRYEREKRRKDVQKANHEGMADRP